ncbi:hypothetical protein ROA7745_04195 [Roseovarius aestuarii]|uniref:Uncharacterized protein n=1 Tax=Roseovarius aestuarii TaxID=475083 RepID=A0A1X7BXJ9_9RHOB|nr:hypothetical protein ROA7745_04195 [Roseovarius aestuarii]
MEVQKAPKIILVDRDIEVIPNTLIVGRRIGAIRTVQHSAVTLSQRTVGHVLVYCKIVDFYIRHRCFLSLYPTQNGPLVPIKAAMPG